MVILFVVTPFFRRRKRGPRYARDDMPMAPLFEVFLFWMLLAMGGLLGAVALGALYATLMLGLTLERLELIAVVLMAVASIACFTVAMRMWFRLNRGR